jgi:DNA-binding beta-propeller fold protein YncE
LEQDENEQNCKKGPTPVVGKKPDGKSRMKPMRILLVAFLVFAAGGKAQNPASFQIDLPGAPFGVAVSRDQQWVFVSLTGGGAGQGPGIAVLRNDHGHVELARTVAMGRSPTGIVLTHNGDMLIAAAGDAVVFFDTQRLETGASDAAFQWVSGGENAESIYVNVTADDKTLFVSDEAAERITVMDLDKIRSLGRDSAANLKRGNARDGASSAIIGRIPTGVAPIALTFSKDQRWLFTTSQIAPADWGWPAVLEPEGINPGRGKVPEGAVIVIDVAKAKTNAAESVFARVPAGGSPVRLALSPDGSRLFVSARNSNAALVFDTGELVKDPKHAKPTKIPVGSSPVPIVAVADGKFVLVGNSDRFGANAARSSTLSVVDTSLLGTERNPNVGKIPCGAFPREFDLTADGQTLYLTNFRSRTLQVMDVSRLMTILEK